MREEVHETFQPKSNVTISGFRLTHPERVLWEDRGITKDRAWQSSMLDIADWILPHVTGRVLSLVRCPSGHKRQVLSMPSMPGRARIQSLEAGRCG